MTGSLYSAPSNHLRRASFYGNCSHESVSVTSYQLCTSGRCTLSPILLLLSIKMDWLQGQTRAACFLSIADLRAFIRTWKDGAEVPWPSISESETKGVQGQGRSDEECWPGRTSCDTSRTCKSLEAIRGEGSKQNWKQHLALAENPEGSSAQSENKGIKRLDALWCWPESFARLFIYYMKL